MPRPTPTQPAKLTAPTPTAAAVLIIGTVAVVVPQGMNPIKYHGVVTVVVALAAATPATTPPFAEEATLAPNDHSCLLEAHSSKHQVAKCSQLFVTKL
mmetsp:Transcript_109227/g.308082  ORF Transcript_109227/g.308082 Transcript_109227/m.308082 type:complete len:98 (+) Transcript_109227:493-786(+)